MRVTSLTCAGLFGPKFREIIHTCTKNRGFQRHFLRARETTGYTPSVQRLQIRRLLLLIISRVASVVATLTNEVDHRVEVLS